MNIQKQKDIEATIRALYEAMQRFPAIIWEGYDNAKGASSTSQSSFYNKGNDSVIREMLECIKEALNKHTTDKNLISFIFPYFQGFQTHEEYKQFKPTKLSNEYLYLPHSSLNTDYLICASKAQRAIADEMELGRISDCMLGYQEEGGENIVNVIRLYKAGNSENNGKLR